MKIKKPLAFFLSILLISTGVATAQVKASASPDTSSTPTVTPQIAPVPALGNQEREELERLRQENSIRDRVQSEVDRAFSRTTTLLNALLFVLIMFPFATAFGFWLLRRSIIYQVASETKNLLDQAREKFERQLVAEITAELKDQMKAFQEETATIKANTATQITSLISDSQAALEELRQQKDILEQEINRLMYEQYYQAENLVEQEVEPLDSDALSEILDIGEDDPFETPSQALDATGYLHQGNLLFSEGRYGEANQAYNEAIQLDRDFSEARYQNARCYSILGRVNPAIGNLQWAIDIDQKYREMAKNDSAFHAIRQDEQFKKMMEDI